MKNIQYQSIITFSHCQHQAIEKMPTNYCQYVWDCPHCHKQLRPYKGDCCVYCRNDALGNLLIIIAGLLIMRTGTNWPDLIVGTMIGLLVVYSAVKITQESLIILQEKKS